MNIRTQRLAVHSFWVFLAVTLLGWSVLAGFLPPPDPSLSADQVAAYYSGKQDRIRLGMTVALASSVLLYLWGGAVYTQLRRIEGRHATLSITWLSANIALSMAFIMPYYFWGASAFRPDVSPETIQHFNDIAWLFFIQFVWAPMLQCAILAYLTFGDRRPNPIYPRWFGYYNVMVALLLIPAGMIFFFKDGPLAWDGLFAFWLSIVDGFSWLMVITVMTAKAIKRQAAEPDPEPAGAGPDADLRARVEALEAQLQRQSPTAH